MSELLKITSRDNERLKRARNVRDGRETTRIFIEGLRLAEEAVRSALELSECFLSEEFVESSRAAGLVDRLRARSVELFELPDKILRTIADTDNPQGIVLLANRPKSSEPLHINTADPAARGPVVVLHEVNNPANAGAAARSAEAAGAAGLILTRQSVDIFSPKSVRASMGSCFRLPIWSGSGLTEVIEWARKNGLRSVAADTKGGKNYLTIDWTRPSMLVFGSEGHGLNEAELAMMDETAYIPMENDVESLNIAVSCGIILFEAKRQTSR